MSPFATYELMCPSCGHGMIQGEGARHQRYLWSCMKCGRESFSRTTFKKTRVLQMKRWREKKTVK